LPNHLDDSFDILHHIGVPEPDDPVAMSRQLLGAAFVTPGIRMLAPIDFDHQLSCRAREIGNAPADRVLTTESPWELVLAERVPEAPFDLRRLAAKPACSDRSLAKRQDPTSPILSAPQGRRGKF
jgi:hypothetical protein